MIQFSKGRAIWWNREFGTSLQRLKFCITIKRRASPINESYHTNHPFSFGRQERGPPLSSTSTNSSTSTLEEGDRFGTSCFGVSSCDGVETRSRQCFASGVIIIDGIVKVCVFHGSYLGFCETYQCIRCSRRPYNTKEEENNLWRQVISPTLQGMLTTADSFQTAKE